MYDGYSFDDQFLEKVEIFERTGRLAPIYGMNKGIWYVSSFSRDLFRTRAKPN